MVEQDVVAVVAVVVLDGIGRQHLLLRDHRGPGQFEHAGVDLLTDSPGSPYGPQGVAGYQTYSPRG